MTAAATFQRQDYEGRIDVGVDTRLILRKLLRRKWLVLASTIVLFAAFATAIVAMPPWYTAETEIVIDQRPQGADLAAVLSRLPTDSQAVLTEAEALRSRSLVEKVIEQLDMLSNPEFNPNIIPQGDDSMWARWRRLKHDVSLQIAAAIGSHRQVSENSVLNTAVKIFLKDLHIVPVGRSQVLHATFTSQSPELAQKVLNTLVSQYLAAQIEHRSVVPEALVTFMRGELDRLQARVRTADQALEQYRNSANLQQGITQGREALLSTQELSDANSELISVRSKRQQAQIRLGAIRANPNAFPDVLASASIQQLQGQLSAQRESLSQLLAMHGPSYPKVEQVQAGISDTEQRIRAETAKIVDSVRSEVAVLTERQRELADTLAGTKQQIGDSGESRVTLARLEQEAQVSRSILTSFLTQYNQLASQRALQVADSYVLSAADRPSERSFPPTVPFMGVAAIASFAVACCGALLLERRGDTIRSAREVLPLLMVRPLGMVPKLPAGNSVVAEVLDKATSPFTESIRGILSSLRIAADRSRVILVTSVQPGEGKTSLATALLRLASLSGSKVLLIDCDLRCPGVHSALQSAAAPGLTELLQGRSTLREVCRRDVRSALDFIPSGDCGPHAANLLSGASMRSLVANMREKYDLVVLDSPPSSMVSDARILAHLADEAVLVVSWNKTPWRLVREEIEHIAYGKDNLAGVVLNKVDMRRHSRDYGYPTIEPSYRLTIPSERRGERAA